MKSMHPSPAERKGTRLPKDRCCTAQADRICGLARIAASLLVLATGQQAKSATHVLENDRLRLEVVDNSAAGFSYRLIDTSSGTTLVTQDLAQFTFGVQGPRTAQSGSLTGSTASSLSFDLTFDGIAVPGTATYALAGSNLTVDIAHPSATQVAQRFDDRGENLYGLFEFDFVGGGFSLNNRGLDRQTLGMQGGVGTDDASARAPFYVTDAGYGVYAQTAALGRYQMAENLGGGELRSTFGFDDDHLTYHVIAGTPKEVMQGYNDIAGGAFMPPDWALGSIWWRDDAHQNLNGQPNAQQRILQDAEELRNRQLPATALWVDRPWTDSSAGWGDLDAQNRFLWDSSGGGFPDPTAMVQTLRETYGMELMAWIANRTDINPSNEFGTQAPAAAAKFSGGSLASFDLRDPDSFNWVRNTLATIASEYGVAGYKIDRGDQNEMPNSAVNENLTLFGQASVESLLLGGIDQPFVFARAVYDTGRQYTAVWNGDTTRDFTGLQVSMVNLLRSGTINMPMYGSDTGGFNNTPSAPKVFARWLGFSAYNPLMEIPLGRSGTDWNSFTSEDLEAMAAHVKTHHDLIPYVRSYLYQATQTGLAVARPMVFEFPDDPIVKDMADQYMYGDTLLVAPIVTSSDSRGVYLPAGQWLDYNDKVSRFDGQQTVVVSDVGLDRVPAFARIGGIVVRGDIIQANNDWTPNWAPSLSVEVFLPDGSQSNSFSYYTGADTESVVSIDYAKTADGVEVAFQDLGADGWLSLYLDDATESNLLDGAWTVVRDGQLLASTDYLLNADQSLLQVSFAGGTTLSLSAGASVIPGDYNQNGVVDAADYTVWRDHLGQVFSLPNEGANSSPGEVTSDDYDFWKSQFGQPIAGHGSLESIPTPEPASWAILCVALPAVLIRRGRLHRCVRRRPAARRGRDPLLLRGGDRWQARHVGAGNKCFPAQIPGVGLQSSI
jgi:alpha-glucosidase (family GH31 glycosyl hydrolase)